VIILQRIFLTWVNPREYARQGVDFEFPAPETCPNPECLMPIAPKKHGFYERNCLDFCYRGRILIRRYYCPYCGNTISYLPSFCLPYYQYSLAVIYLVITNYIKSSMSYARIIRQFRNCYPELQLEIQHIEFYLLRFLMNLNTIQIGLRQFWPDICLPDFGLDIKKGAEKILHIVNDGFGEIHTFSQRFFEQCKRSFMSPLQNILA
jgi:hypothetical protein